MNLWLIFCENYKQVCEDNHFKLNVNQYQNQWFYSDIFCERETFYFIVKYVIVKYCYKFQKKKKNSGNNFGHGRGVQEANDTSTSC